jgi:ribose transport system ATP-binding protein
MLLELRAIQKRFGGVTALADGSLAVQAGEVHLLLGENGAGKSTLMRIVAGMHSADSGEMRWKGRPVLFGTPAEAQSHGIAMVHQESLLAQHLSVAENIVLGREPRLPCGWIQRRRAVEEARRLIAEHRFPLQAEWRVDRLSPAGKQLVEICRALAHGSSLLIFDEPTSSLSDAESQEVFRIVRHLRDRGSAVIYITHRLEELRSLGDRVTVLRDGATAHTGPVAETTTAELIRHMAGRELSALYHRDPLPPGRELLRAEHLSRRPLLKDISFTLRAGEIVGLAGLIGAGRTELCRALFGAEPIDGGRIILSGSEVRIGSPRDAVAHGLALVPEDRQQTGLATSLPVGHNMTLAALPAVCRFGFINSTRERDLIAQQTARLRLKAESPRQLAGRLSGGNQQKVVLSKWLVRGASVYLFDEPTRGIDIGAKAEVFQLIDSLARAGAAILMVSSELPELAQVADRILVMRHGCLAADLPRGASQEEILRHAVLEGQNS